MKVRCPANRYNLFILSFTMHTLLLEPSAHFTGELLVGLLCDLGVKPSTFEWELGKVDLGALHLHFDRRDEGEAHGVHFGIHTGGVHTHDQDADAGTSHETHVGSHADGEEVQEREHHHHLGNDDHESRDDDLTAAQVRERLDTSELSDALKVRVLTVFDQFCAHEAKVLGADAQELTFDEDSALVGAQIVCACVGLAELGIEYVRAAEPPDESVAAGILAVYRRADGAVPAPSEAKAGYGIGDEGWLRGVLG
jgi:uncharacterized protein (DUF111 family)